ncbi:MAG TPA: hypothetical protein VD947_03975 [Patescibacteria group bacterium]|nr:hypothetical protein [Patescibacteria group bacterium]
MLTDREIATLIIFGAIFTAALLSKTVRKSLLDVLRSILNKYILGPILVYLAYSATLIWAAWSLGWWNTDLLKDTFIVVFITGIGMLFRANTIKSGSFLIKKTILSTVGLAALITFYVNLSSFNVISEIIFQLVIGAAVLLSIVAKHQLDHSSKSLAKFFDAIVVIGGIVLIIKTTADFKKILASEGPLEIFEPLILTVWFPLMLIPFVYIFSLVINIQSLLKGLSAISNDPIKLRVIAALLVGLRFSVKYASSFIGHWRMDITEISTYRETQKLMHRFRQNVRLRDDKIKTEQRKLKKYAGVNGVDNEGRQLDRREFKETQRLLIDLYFYQMGMYRGRLGHYFENSLILLNNNEYYGLKTDLNVTVKLSKNKRSWYAWRRTASGWVFAAGGSKDIDVQWRYDGSEPPKSFPGHIKDEWSSESGTGTALNWTDYPPKSY